jgi:hypothetical protein
MISLRNLLGTLVLCCATPAWSQPTPAPDAAALVTPEVVSALRGTLNVETVAISIEAQNERYQRLTPDKIKTLDQQWVDERKAADKPLIASTLSNPLSVYLARVQGKSLGAYVEIFVMDRNGLNVGQSSITSDFWQGDEDKFTRTYPKGSDAVFLDEAEWDEERGIWIAQLSMTLVNAASQAIGAATVDLNLTELQRRKDLNH